MLFSEVKKVLAGNSEKAFDSITEEMCRHRPRHYEEEFDEMAFYDIDYGPDEYVILTWHGYSIKIHYNGTAADFMKKLRICYDHFDQKKYAAKLEKKKGTDHETAIEAANEIYNRLGYSLHALLRSDALQKQKAHEQENGGCICEYWDLILASTLLPEYEYASVYFHEGSYGEVGDIPGHVYVPGKAPTEEEFNEIFGNLNGRTLNEVMKFLKAFSEITLTEYNVPYGCKSDMEVEKDCYGITPEERERHHLEWEISDEVSDSEEGKERRRNMSYGEWETWLENEVQRRVEEKLKAKETEKKNNGDTDGPDGCSP